MSGEEQARSEKLARILADGADWEKTRTSIEGVMIVRMPQYKSRPPTLAIEINPIDASGSATKKRGVVIRSAAELALIAQILANPDLAKLAEAMDLANPATSTPKKSSDVFQV